MSAQQHADNENSIYGKPLMSAALALRKLSAALVDANDLCRSAMQIANRERKRLAFQPHQQENATNWETFRDCLSESLDRQHRVMYPPNVKLTA